MSTTLRKATSIVVALLLAMLLLPVSAFATGTAGSITVKNPQAGETYEAYKIFDVVYNSDKTAYVYTINSNDPESWFNVLASKNNETGDATAKDGVSLTFEKTKDAGIYVVKMGDDFKAPAFAEILKNNIGDRVGASFTEQSDGSLKASGLALGYYFVNPTVGTLCSLTTTSPEVEVYDKNDRPEVDKKITNPSSGGDATHTNAAIGDTINFELASKVPDMTGYEKYYFVMTDTMSKGLTFQNDVTIKIGDKTLTSSEFNVHQSDQMKTERDDSGKEVKVATGNKIIEIVFVNFKQYDTDTFRGKDIKVSYSAILNKDAIIGVDGNTNEVKLNYSHDPNEVVNGDPEDGDKPADPTVIGEDPGNKTYTYVTGIDLIKIDPNGNHLTDAEFEISGTMIKTIIVEKDVYTKDTDGQYYLLKTGQYTTTAPVEEGDGSTLDQYVSTDKYSKSRSSEEVDASTAFKTNATVGSDGVLRFDGLAAGEYTIKEIKAPEGYQLLTDEIKVDVTWVKPSAAGEQCTWSATNKQTDDKLVTYGVVNGRVQVQVENHTGSALPSTGGIGTTIFYVGGAVLMLGAIVAFVIKRRSAKHTV